MSLLALIVVPFSIMAVGIMVIVCKIKKEGCEE